MLYVATYVAPSTIHGFGLFANQDIPKGTLLWKFEENFDRRYTEEEFKKLNPLIHEYFSVYGYRDIQDGLFYITCDNDRFFNHSDTPNTYFDDEGYPHAAVDIRKGEEITTNYKDFYMELPSDLRHLETRK